MGIDALDIVFRLEKAFEIKIPPGRLYWSDEDLRLKRYPPFRGANDPTVGEIHDRLCDYLRDLHLEIPADSWERVQRCIAGCLVIPADGIRRSDRLVADLGIS